MSEHTLGPLSSLSIVTPVGEGQTARWVSFKSLGEELCSLGHWSGPIADLALEKHVRFRRGLKFWGREMCWRLWDWLGAQRCSIAPE